MGEVHAIEGDPSSGRCVVVNRYTGERTAVATDPDKTRLLAEPGVAGACPLFRRGGDGRGVCPVHKTWPDVCAGYACWRILVLGPSGGRAARVMGHRHIAVDDPGVEGVLAPHSAALARTADDGWDALLADILERAGFRVVR